MYEQLLLLDLTRVHDITIFMCIIILCLRGLGQGAGGFNWSLDVIFIMWHKIVYLTLSIKRA